MQKVIHRNNDRGFTDHGWLKAHHSFSFGGWFNPAKINFGKLRVLNDDIISPGKGFSTHPHENMEIVTIPLEGKLAHKDSMGHEEILKPNEVQVMSAGTGILHSEYNASDTEQVNLLQIWIFPDKDGHIPRYNQKEFDPTERKDNIQMIISPRKSKANLWLHQNAYFSRCDLNKNATITYKLNDLSNGVYIFLISGIIKVDEDLLSPRDAIGIWGIETLTISATNDAEILFIEVPMN